MALEVTAAIIGILAAAGKVAETLGPLVSAYVSAPKHAQTILTEIQHTRTALLGLQCLFDELPELPQQRKELIPVNQLILTFTDGVLLFSELEAHANVMKTDPTYANRFRWAKKARELDKCVARLLSFKTSMVLMLSILQCESDMVAENDRAELRMNTAELLRHNLELSQRLANLEYRLQGNQSFVTTRPASLATSHTTVRATNAALAESYVHEPCTVQDETVRNFLFEPILIASRVYRRVRRESENLSFRSSSFPSRGWSALSDVSLSDISVISVVALPLGFFDVGNGHRYAYKEHSTNHYDSSAFRSQYDTSVWEFTEPQALPWPPGTRPVPFPVRQVLGMSYTNEGYLTEEPPGTSPVPFPVGQDLGMSYANEEYLTEEVAYLNGPLTRRRG